MTDRELLEKAARDGQLAQRVARILGPSSAPAQAIAEAERSRAAGVPAAVIYHRKWWLVVRAAAALGEQGK